MNLDSLLEKRRALRSIEKMEISDEMIHKMSDAAKLAPSCYNNQPWNFVFVKEENQLQAMYQTLSKGNDWAFESSLIIAVFTKKEKDCVVTNREYYLFDTGMATAFMQLKAVELGITIHPIAGFDEKKAKEILEIPVEYQIITLLICGKETDAHWNDFPLEVLEIEQNRPVRKSFDEFCYMDKFKS